MPVSVTIYDRLRFPEGWGTPHSLPGGRPSPVVQAAETLAQGLAILYGGNVEFFLVDIDSPEMQDHPKVLELVKGGGPRPIVEIDGGPIITGGFSMIRITQELDRLGVPRSR